MTAVVAVSRVLLTLPPSGAQSISTDRPSGKLTVAGSLVEFHIAVAPPGVHRPSGTLKLAGSLAESAPAGSWRSPFPSHTGASTWVKIDTTGLWSANGGTLSGAQTLTIDGTAASTLYGAGYPGNPTVGTPIVTLLMARGVHTFALGGYSYTMDCYWRGVWSWLQTESALSANALFFNGALAGNANVGATGPGWQNWAVNNNGYGFTTGAGNSAFFIVAPGDEGWVVSGTPTADTRAEPNITDLNYIPVDGSANDLRPTMPFGPARGLDLFGNFNLSKHFYRFDWKFPTSYTAPVTVRNDLNVATFSTLSAPLTTGGPIASLPIAAATWSLGATAATITLDDQAGHTQTWTTAGQVLTGATSIATTSQTPSFAFPATTTLVKILWKDYRVSKGQAHVWPNSNVNPTTGLANSTSATVTNSSSALQLLSNAMENQGPADFVWAGGTSGGVSASRQFRYQPTSMGIGLVQATFDTIPNVLNAQESTIVEYTPGLYATTNGVPWTVSSPDDALASQTSKHTAVSTTGTNGVVTGSGFAANMVGTQWGFLGHGGAGLFRVLSFQSLTQITMSTTVPFADTTTMYQLPFSPYGSPPGTPGGGGIRIWRRTGTGAQEYLNWTCVTNGHASAVPGTAALDSGGNITGGNAGIIFGATLKTQGANLLTGPQGASGIVLAAATAAPFDITVNNVVGGTAFRPSTGGPMSIDGEQMMFSSYTSGSKTLHVTARGLQGTTPADHSVGAQVWGMVDVNVLSPGLNADQAVPVPIVVQEWPPEVGGTFLGVWHGGAPLA